MGRVACPLVLFPGGTNLLGVEGDSQQAKSHWVQVLPLDLDLMAGLVGLLEQVKLSVSLPHLPRPGVEE